MAEASAAVAAAQLLAFCKDPVRYRPRLTHGREIPAVGIHVFRFAQGKFPNGLLRELPAPERDRLRKAANLFIRQVCLWDGATHYQVLCVPQEARRETIKEHYHLLIALIHPDRQDADSAHWPPEAAHRVNLAYAVLSDEARRVEYDARLHKSMADREVREDDENRAPETASVRVPVKGRFAAARMRFRKPFLFGSAAVASLFFLQTWLAADVGDDYATLESATPLSLSVRFVRNVFSSSDRPRYLMDAGGGAASPPPAGGAATGQDAEHLLTPLFRIFSNEAPSARREPAVPGPTASVGTSAQAPMATAAAPRSTSETGMRAKTPVGVSPPAQPVRGERDPTGVGQASVKQTETDRALASLDLEMLIASVVAYYEAGELDRLLGLMDVNSLSVWEAMRLRGDFRDFFQSTSRRHLHFQRVTWDSAEDVARAKGQATLVAEFRDDTPRLERVVAIEMDVRMRDGQPRIARLSLYPHE